jgi:hypothetical protein
MLTNLLINTITTVNSQNIDQPPKKTNKEYPTGPVPVIIIILP